MTPDPPVLVAVDGAELCVQSFGDAAAPPVLLVAGAASPMDWWYDGLCSRVADGGYRVVRYDHRDTGRSTTGEPGHPAYDVGALERDASALASWLGPPVHLVGLSMGGGIAQSLALVRPELVASLTLVATSPVGGVDGALPGPDGRVSAEVTEPDWSDVDAVVEHQVAVQRVYAGRAWFEESRTRSIARRVVLRSHDVAAAGNHWLALGADGADPTPLDVTGVGVPTLVVHGTDDPLFPLPHGEALAGAIPGAQLLAVDGMGHEVPPPPTWDEVVPTLLRHFATPQPS